MWREERACLGPPSSQRTTLEFIISFHLSISSDDQVVGLAWQAPLPADPQTLFFFLRLFHYAALASFKHGALSSVCLPSTGIKGMQHHVQPRTLLNSVHFLNKKRSFEGRPAQGCHSRGLPMGPPCLRHVAGHPELVCVVSVSLFVPGEVPNHDPIVGRNQLILRLGKLTPSVHTHTHTQTSPASKGLGCSSVAGGACPLLASLSQRPKSVPCAWICSSSFCSNRVS